MHREYVHHFFPNSRTDSGGMRLNFSVTVLHGESMVKDNENL